MSNLDSVDINKIETDIMSVLYSNMNFEFTQSELYTKLLKEKYDLINKCTSIHPSFKSKFLLIIRNLMFKYNDIKITRKNNTYNILCLSSPDVKPHGMSVNNTVNTVNAVNAVNGMLDMSPVFEINNNDISLMYDYMYDNGLVDCINWIDPHDGNSIFHELVLNNNDKIINRLIKDGTFEFNITNNRNQTPIDLINSISTAKIITNGLINKLISNKVEFEQKQEKQLELFKKNNDKVDYYMSDEYKNKIINDANFLNIILTKTQKYHFDIKMYMSTLLFCYLTFKFIF